MPSDPEPPSKTGSITRRRIRLRRRRKLPIVHLGGDADATPQQGEELVSMTQKMKVKVKYFFTLRKLKDYYQTVVKEFVEAGGSVNSLQQKIMMESSFTVPIKGVAVSSFPSVSGAGAAKRRG
ncbi:hypothetical protein PVL29_011162 [Vitis rotundifolia]|uniref:Uncharacterized protein n=1 Tax=Vitis rotundifolia TaxID=103349 RepID=A0AA38ZNM9_VITRO|nr:hypothetical protein PVL29_011162 [Vitis rotundifolia]